MSISNIDFRGACMPKIEVNKKYFFSLLGKEYSMEELEDILTFAKAELDSSKEEYDREDNIKIELNDTNRPDLWSEIGLARCLNILIGHKSSNRILYKSFLSKTEEDANERIIRVSSSLKDIRAYIAGFLIRGKKISDAELASVIQTQEKLSTNYGRKRRTLAMGIYRASLISWPLSYSTETSSFAFSPLGFENSMSIKDILKKHPKGIEYAHIFDGIERYPILKDVKEATLSFPPIINSNDIGSVKEGDDLLFVEFTGQEKNIVLLACNIVACDFADLGWEVLPVKVENEDETIVCPIYFQKPIKISISYINRLLGSSFSMSEVIFALQKMDVSSAILDSNTLEVLPSPYRNDYLHPIDVVEDVMIAIGLSSFEVATPKDFTIGRLLPSTTLGRKIKKLLIGMGYEELIFNYLGSGDDFITKMGISGENVIEISNPISENYQFVRPSILPSLLYSESSSHTSSYPHKIFEIGKVAVIDEASSYGTTTLNHLSFLTAEKDANYNKIASEVAALFYYLDIDYNVLEEEDTRFISGRVASINVAGKKIGVFGELSPELLTRWEISMPSVALEISLDSLPLPID